MDWRQWPRPPRATATCRRHLRKTSLLVAGQEVLTSDNVGIKASLLVTYQVNDPVKAAHETQNWQGDLYQAAQIAFRAVAGGVTIEALLGQRLDIGTQLLARVQPEAAKIGISVLAVEVKDVTLPNDLKRAFADVLKAKQEGQAALERARGESASLRNLANAARVLEGNPALMNLRLMQSLSAAQNAGSILVVGRVKTELEAALGRPMALSSVYNLLHRHGWRKLTPDKRHPQSDPLAQQERRKNLPSESKSTRSGPAKARSS